MRGCSIRSARCAPSGNTLVVVEHDEDTMRFADRIIDLGPGAGTQGGAIVAEGPWNKLATHAESATGRIFGAPLQHPLRGERRPAKDATRRWFRVLGAHANNLKRIDAALPAGRFIALCGVSGAGKSTLLHDVIKPAAQAAVLARKKRRAKAATGPWKKLEGFEIFTSVYEVDQAPIGKTSRSTPATYIGLMDEIRGLFARLPLARQRGYEASRFSFNSGDGRCPACMGQGAVKVEMNFLPSTFVPCETCAGRRYNPETLEVLIQRQVDLRRARPDHRRRRSISSPTCRACTGRWRCCATRASATSRSASAAPRFPAARRSASSWSRSWRARWK